MFLKTGWNVCLWLIASMTMSAVKPAQAQVNIVKNEQISIEVEKIEFEGNTLFSDAQLRKATIALSQKKYL